MTIKPDIKDMNEFETELKAHLKSAPPSEKYKTIGFLTASLLCMSASGKEVKIDAVLKLMDFLEAAFAHATITSVVKGASKGIMDNSSDYTRDQLSALACLLKELNDVRKDIPVKQLYEQLQNLMTIIEPPKEP